MSLISFLPKASQPKTQSLALSCLAATVSTVGLTIEPLLVAIDFLSSQALASPDCSVYYHAASSA